MSDGKASARGQTPPGPMKRKAYDRQLSKLHVELVARPPKPITAGFAFKGNDLYFASGPDIYRYVLPRKGM